MANKTNNIIEENEVIQKTIKVPKELLEKILKDAEKDQRDFTKQVIFMIKKYYDIKES